MPSRVRNKQEGLLLPIVKERLKGRNADEIANTFIYHAITPFRTRTVMLKLRCVLPKLFDSPLHRSPKCLGIF